MKRFTLIATMMLAFGSMWGQTTYPFVSITNINQPADLANCNDTSAYYQDTITTVGVVVTDGGLSEVASSTVIGGYRPFIHIVDTASNGDAGAYKGLELQAVYENAQGALQALSSATTLFAGDIIKITGYLDMYENNNQLNTLNANSIQIIGSQSAPTSAVVSVGDLNDANRVNQVQTGEQWENAFVELQNVTVSSVIPFGNGRYSFDVVDAQGNRINVSDRFLAQKTSSYQTVNPNTPSTTGYGSFVPPVPGTFYNSLSGIVRQSGNGCTGGTGRGYEINPFKDSHYNIGFAPPYISEVERDPLVPNHNQSVDITATITDFDGSVDSIAFAYSTNSSVQPINFPVYPMTLSVGSTDEYEYTIPAQPNGTVVRYYIYAKDNDGNESWYPSKPVGQTQPNYNFYTVRNGGLNIQDIQFTLDPSGNSPYIGQTVTVKGVVTASMRDYDLGYVYIQDTGATQYAGVSLAGNFDLQNVYRNEWIEVTGTVTESYGLTQIVVDNVTRLGVNDSTIKPVVIDPSDSTARMNGDWEKYEGMLVRFANPDGGKLYVTDGNVGFGEYTIADDTTYGQNGSARILAGRDAGSSAASSLWVSLVSDTTYSTVDGIMYVPAIAANDTMTMDSVQGIMYYSFSNYKITPRANDDFFGLNVDIDTNVTHPVSSLSELYALPNVAVYPNPADAHLKVVVDTHKDYTVSIYDLNGKELMEQTAKNGMPLNLNTSILNRGFYLVKVSAASGRTIYSGKLMINH